MPPRRNEVHRVARKGRFAGGQPRRVVGGCCHLAQALRHGHQRGAQVAAVHGGHIRRWQHRQRARVDPVVEVAAVARQRLQRVQRRADAFGGVALADEAEAPGAQHRQQVHADVGG